MPNTISLKNVEIEDQVVLDAIISAMRSDKKIVNSIKKFLFTEMELLDTRNDVEKKRTK